MHTCTHVYVCAHTRTHIKHTHKHVSPLHTKIVKEKECVQVNVRSPPSPLPLSRHTYRRPHPQTNKHQKNEGKGAKTKNQKYKQNKTKQTQTKSKYDSNYSNKTYSQREEQMTVQRQKTKRNSHRLWWGLSIHSIQVGSRRRHLLLFKQTTPLLRYNKEGVKPESFISQKNPLLVIAVI